ncbi:MAG: glycosyltransferase, partial [Bacteroidota bacterium]
SSAAIVETFQKGSANIRLLTIEANTTDMPNKKNALRTGITEAKNDILVFTDADCVAGKGWLRSISEAFTENIGVVAGYSPYGKENTSSFLRYEENKNSLFAAGAVELDHAYMCTGRNFAYRRSVYNEVGGFE